MQQPATNGPSGRGLSDARGSVEDAERALRALDHVQRLATVGSMAAGVAHEINNLLTPALAYAQLARSGRGDDPEFLGKAVDRAVEGIEAATTLLASVLDLSRPDAADEACGVLDATRRAIECLARRPQRDGVEVVISIPDDLRATIGRLTLQQVLLNLLLNAMKAIRDGRGGRIEISASARPGGRVRISVLDDGPGVPIEVRDRLFEPFVTTGGHGLGLSICREAVSAAGGTISLGPQRDRGAELVIDLAAPAADGSAHAAHARAS